MTMFFSFSAIGLRRGVFLSLLTLMLSISTATAAQDFELSNDFTVTEDTFLDVHDAYRSSGTISPSGTAQFEWAIEDGYYLYGHMFGLQVKTADGIRTLDISVPPGKLKFDEIFQQEFEVYYHNAKLHAQLPELDQAYELILSWQGCADAGLCYPPETQVFYGESGAEESGALTLLSESNIVLSDTSTLNSTGTESIAVLNTNSTQNPVSAEPAAFLPLVLLGALIGGMILNLMPCVFPVLSLKALSLASGSESEHKTNGWAYTAGVVSSFALVALIIIAAKSAGTTLGWGFQLQQPVFVAALVYVFFLLAMNLFGLFEIGTSWMGIGSNLTQGNGKAASFFTGVLAAVVASPCTAPFMASAIGFTITQSALVALLVFVCLGFGMALPYLLLSHSPTLASRMPKPGIWMLTFKQFLAFPLLFTCVWLLVVVGNQTSAYSIALLVGGTIALAMAFWLWQHQGHSPWRWLVRSLVALLAAAALHIVYNIEDFGHKENELWQPYSAELLGSLRAKGQPVFIDLTADWCITCKINESIALDTDAVMTYAQANNVTMLRGDWTRSDPEITKLLREFQRNGVPLYLMYPADPVKGATVLPQILTQAAVLDAMRNAIQK